MPRAATEPRHPAATQTSRMLERAHERLHPDLHEDETGAADCGREEHREERRPEERQRDARNRALGPADRASEDILRRHAEHDLTDGLVVQDAPLALLRDRVDVAQTAFERVFLEHRHRAAMVKQRIDDLA